MFAIHLFFVVDVFLGMDEIYEIAQQAKYRFLGVSEMYQICDGWNMRNRPISYRVWIWIVNKNRSNLDVGAESFVLQHIKESASSIRPQFDSRKTFIT